MCNPFMNYIDIKVLLQQTNFFNYLFFLRYLLPGSTQFLMRSPLYNMKYNSPGMTRSNVLFTSRYGHLWDWMLNGVLSWALYIIAIHLFCLVEPWGSDPYVLFYVYMSYKCVEYIHTCTQVTYKYIYLFIICKKN